MIPIRLMICILWMGIFCKGICQTLPAPMQLRCDLLVHTDKVTKSGLPVKESLEKATLLTNQFQFAKIISSQPVFNWQVPSNLKQLTAAQILVASTPQLLQSENADIWNSHKISIHQSRIQYAGNPLIAGKVYYWKLRYWDNNGRVSAYSATNSFYQSLPDSGEIFSHYPLAASWQKPVVILKTKSNDYFIDFGKDAFAKLQLHLDSPVDDSIWVEASEALDSPGIISTTGGNIRYINKTVWVKKGQHDYQIDWPVNDKRNARNPVQMPAYIGEVFPFRYVRLKNFQGKVQTESVTRKMVYYPFNDSIAQFVSSDTVLNKVWDLCKYSIKATSFAGYYVDGDRERLPYEADALINQLSHYSVDAEYSMARRSMAFLLFHPTWPTEWSLQNVLLAWNDYLYTGDDAFLKKYYAELQKKILMPLAGPTGLISTRAKKQTDDFLLSIHMEKDFDGKHGLKDNVDWPQKGAFVGNEKEYGGETDGFVYTDYNAVVNAFYYRCLQLMQKIATVLGKQTDADFYTQKSTLLYNAFQQMYSNPQNGLVKDGDTTNHSSLHANMFALAFGLVPAENKERIIQFIKSRKMACSVYGAQFLLDALYDAEEDGYALDLLTATTQRSWYNMLRTGSTITMEAWDKLYKPNLDLNHAWGSAPANIIVRKLMGIEPLSPGADTLRIKPQLGRLSFAKLTTATLKGKIELNCRNTSLQNTMEINIPGATIAHIYFKADPLKKGLWVDGKHTNFKPVNGFYIIPNMTAGHHLLSLQ